MRRGQAVSLSLLLIFTTSLHATGMVGLSGPTDASNTVDGISADGRVIVGTSNGRVFRWTQSGGMVDLGTQLGFAMSTAKGVSADGVLVGSYANSDSNSHAFRWTESGGMVDLGFLPGAVRSDSNAVSADGEVVVGNSGVNGQIFRWTQSGGMAELPPLPDAVQSVVFDVSADGAVVVGNGIDVAGNPQAFRWTLAGGTVRLGSLPGATMSSVRSVSSDGSVVVGLSGIPGVGSAAFRWTQSAGMVAIGVFPQGTQSFVTSLSPNGSVMVGYGDIGKARYRAFRWTKSSGLVSRLVSLGEPPPGYVNSYATDVCPDGTVVAGYWSTADGQMQAFRWTKSSGMVGLGMLPGNKSSIAAHVSDRGDVIVGQSYHSRGSQGFRWAQ